jgi:hypothetical protein
LQDETKFELTFRLVEDNDVPDAGGLNNLDLSHDVDKIRYIISYYNELSQPNNVKDGVLLAQRDAIRYESTGKSNLTKDVTLYFQKLIILGSQITRMTQTKLRPQETNNSRNTNNLNDPNSPYI